MENERKTASACVEALLEIPSACNILSDRISLTQGLVDNIRVKIYPVLREATPSPNTKEPQPETCYPAGIPLKNDLVVFSDRIHGINVALEDLIDRIAL